MRITQTIPIAQIDYRKPLPMNQKSLWFAVQMKLQGVIFPPISVERVKGGRFKLHGGRHRLAAHKLIGKKEIRANVAVVEDPRPDKPLVSKKG